MAAEPDESLSRRQAIGRYAQLAHVIFPLEVRVRSAGVRSAQALPVCRRGHRRERGRQRGADRGFQEAPLTGDGGVPFRGERGFEFVKEPSQAQDYLRRVGAVPTPPVQTALRR